MAETMLHTAGRPRVVVDYDRLLARPAAELNRLAAALGLVVDGETERRIAAYAGEFLSRELRHSEYDRQALAGDPRCPSSALKAYDALACLAGAQGEPTDEQWLWRALDGELRRFAPALSYADAAESQLDAVAQAEKRDAVPSAASAAVRTKEAAPARRGLTAGPRARPPGADEATVSVVIPLYNHERYIEAALTSVLEQTLPPKEIIVVDDGSTDASVAIVRQLAAQEPRIVFWSQPNQGAHRTLNAALHRATGEFVAVLNSDDRYQRERLAICVGHLRRNPQAEAVATALTCIDAEGLSMPSSWYAAALAFYRASGNLALALMHGNFLLTTSNLVARRSLFDAVGYFAPLRYVHDLEFFLRLGIHGRQLDFIDTPLLDYRLHERNTIAENRGRSEIEEAAVFAWFLQFGTGFAGGSDDAWPGRYIETLAQRDLLDPVEYFFALLAGESQPEAPSGWPESALRHALARLGVDCAGAMPAASRLAEFVHARNAHLRRWHRLDGDTVMLDAFAGQQRTAAQMRAGIERQGRELLERGAQVERQGKEIERLNALAEARSRELLERGAQVERQGKEIERLNALAEARSREMVSLLASHWHRLGRALHGEPASLRAAASTVYHLAACLMPRRCRPWLEARAARLAARFAQHAH
jgi:glycosyltransferase involved in cell wall biosynthesis